MVTKPHFLLFCDGQTPSLTTAGTTGAVNSSVRGRWRFVLEDLDAGTRLEVSDAEQLQAPERAALLAVVRGLEALEQPSRVTLVTTSRYVSRGLQFGLVEWRESDYCWEHFGSVQPIRNADLWRRIDHALRYHQVQCRWIAGSQTEVGEAATEIQIEPIAEVAQKDADVIDNRASVCLNKIESHRDRPEISPRLTRSRIRKSSDLNSENRTPASSAAELNSKPLLRVPAQPNAMARFIHNFFVTPIRSLRVPALSRWVESVEGGRIASFLDSTAIARNNRIRRKPLAY